MDSLTLTNYEILPPDQNPARVYIASLPSLKSQRTQGQVIRQMADWLGGDVDSIPWHRLEYQHTHALRARAVREYAPATARKYIAALKGVCKNAWRLGAMESEIYFRAVDLDAVEGTTLLAGRDLSQGEINALIYACQKDSSAAGVRDAAIISVLYMGAARRASVTDLNVEDYDPQRGRLVVHGKRKKDNAVFLSGGGKAALDDWLAIRGPQPGPLFYPVSQLGEVERTGEYMSDQTVYNICVKRGAQAGVSHFTPHDFKRTTIGDLLDRDTDLLTVSAIAAQEDPKVTKRYDRRQERVKEAASRKLHIPWKARS